MKHLVSAFVLLAPLVLPACQAPPDSGRGASSTAAAESAKVFDFSDLRGEATTVEEFVKACQRMSGFNFTYTADTQAAMASIPLHFEGDAAVRAADFEAFLAARLEQRGFTSKRIGPDHLHVILIQQRPS